MTIGKNHLTLAIDNLHIEFDMPDGPITAVKNLSLTIHRGETVAIVGESGSGKSQSALAAMGLLAKNGRVSGSIKFQGEEILGLSQSALNRYRGMKMSMIFQEPMTSLDPLYTIGRQIAEPLIHHRRLSQTQARPRIIELLELVQIPEPERRLKSYPHELSGGQRQRVMIAMALANEPQLLIADEPTTALDVTIQAQILELLAEIQKNLGMAMIFISHDLNIVHRIADRVLVMKNGEVVEEGKTKAIFTNPQHPYTKILLAAEPEGLKDPVPSTTPLLVAENINVIFHSGGSFLSKPHTVHAVNDISLTLQPGQTLGIVGESGSGKSTLGRAILRLLPASGTIVFNGHDLKVISASDLRPLRREMQLVFQDPFGSLSPRMTVGDIITEGLLVHEPHLTRNERDQHALTALNEVGLDAAMRNRYPHEFSGGQRQRIAIARAMILKPKLIVLDEPTSALDRTIQKQVVDLLRTLQSTYHLTYLFISHDLAVVRAMSDEVIVMKSGKIVEQGSTEMIFSTPQQPYTQNLLAAAFDDIMRPFKNDCTLNEKSNKNK